MKSTTEDTRVLPSGATTRTTTTTISGKVAAYQAGKTLTITRFDGSKVTYLINEKSTVPADMIIGKTVTVLPLAAPGRARRADHHVRHHDQDRDGPGPLTVKKEPEMLTILLVIAVLMLLGAIPSWPHSRGWGYGPSGGLGLVVLILVVLLLSGRI